MMYRSHNQLSSQSRPLHPSTLTGESEPLAELDEPPDPNPLFKKKVKTSETYLLSHDGAKITHECRKASLLTRALLSSPELTPVSDIDAPHLTSDGGMTSPTRTVTPSPPLPVADHTGLPTVASNDLLLPQPSKVHNASQMTQTPGINRTEETEVEETLGRRRCISFACGKKTPSPEKALQRMKNVEHSQEEQGSNKVPRKRPCILRFACPMKPSTSGSCEDKLHVKYNDLDRTVPLPPPHSNKVVKADSISPLSKEDSSNSQNENRQISTNIPGQSYDYKKALDASRKSGSFNRVDFQKSEATSFHEFAGCYHTEDEWINEQTAYRHKMTIHDTLCKENAIRRLAEEAEEEALEEDGGLDDDDDDNNSDIESVEQVSDGGNESDDEEGFADSDDESENGSGYEFWTPGLTTAATSIEQFEHIRPLANRVASESSIDSVVPSKSMQSRESFRKVSSKQPSQFGKLSLKRGTTRTKPEDFIIGTLDEDRPLQEAYMFSLEQRKRSKHKLIPQDIDPSFPTSDLEADEDGNESGDEEEEVVDEEEEGKGREEKIDDTTHATIADHITNQPHFPLDEQSQKHKALLETHHKRSGHSPRQSHSPPPRRLFNQSSHRLRSPPPQHRRLVSPPSSRQISPLAQPPLDQSQVMDMVGLARRPNLTHTASLPRTSNPYWDQRCLSRSHLPGAQFEGMSSQTQMPATIEYHTRGPVDIVHGLENKRQRRKEKFWRVHSQKAHAGKEKERKCMPGRGAERMREVGKEMQDRYKGFGHTRVNLMLSI